VFSSGSWVSSHLSLKALFLPLSNVLASAKRMTACSKSAVCHSLDFGTEKTRHLILDLFFVLALKVMVPCLDIFSFQLQLEELLRYWLQRTLWFHELPIQDIGS
jgi:hypothetical protein